MISRKFQGMVLKTRNQNVRIPVGIEMAWDRENDPLAIQMIISVPNESEIAWWFSRSLLKNGINSVRKTGNGDVRFRYSGVANGLEVLYVCLRNATGHADIGLPHHEMLAFLEQTEDVGDDCLETLIDEAIEDILNG